VAVPPRQIERVSIISPMRNEARHVAAFVRDVAEQDFAGAIELIVADGMSEDGSVAILIAEAGRLGVPCRVLPNPAQIVPTGLNACIRVAQGDLLIRMDCHSRYPADYVRRLVDASESTGAWNVGGAVTPQSATTMERAVATAMDSPFGGIGWTRHGTATCRIEVDTVTFGAFRPAAFRRIGLFDETLAKNEDDELNLRMRRAGGRVVLDPAIRVSYTPRGSLRSVFRQYYNYGLWKIPVMRKHRTVLGVRSLAPVGLVGSLAVLASLAGPMKWARVGLAAELAGYVSAASVAAVRAAGRRGEPAHQVPRVIAVFPAFHMGYGVGMAHGFARDVRRRLSGRSGARRVRRRLRRFGAARSHAEPPIWGVS
jgi:GT2 family glycosyltransferase